MPTQTLCMLQPEPCALTRTPPMPVYTSNPACPPMDTTLDAPIFLVEDNPVDLDLTLRAFARQGIRNPVWVARDGEEAVQWLSQWHAGATLPHLVLMDIRLPRIDGLEVLRAFKSDPLLRRVPVVMLSTSTELCDINTAYDHGANSYIVKPTAFDEFMAVAQRIERYWCGDNLTPEPPLRRPVAQPDVPTHRQQP